MKAKVVCKGCANLLVVKGIAPFCLAGAYFVDSELRRKVDVKGVKLAAKVNGSRNCKKKKWLSLNAVALHRWLKKDMKRKGLTYLGRDLSAYKYTTPTLEKKYVGRVPEDSGSPSEEELRSLIAGDGTGNGSGAGDGGAGGSDPGAEARG